MRSACVLLLALGACGGEQDAGADAPPPRTSWVAARTRMVDETLATRGVKDARVLRAMRTVLRHEFVPAEHRRYAYEDDPYHESTIAGTLQRENQFPIDFELDRPAPDDELVSAVDQYQWGARGSCTGYLYYDSVPGGPSLCVIRASNNQFVEFHNGWR